jgi:DNA-binding transcriptional LysR family regulator
MAQGTNIAASIEIGSLPVIKQTVQRGLGIAIMPRLATRPLPVGTLIKTLEDWSLHLPMGLIKKAVPLAQGKTVEALSMLFKQAVTQQAHENVTP